MASQHIDSSVYRILDANLNRAREGFRVLEEYARFTLNDASTSALAKQLRHDLASSIPQKIAEILIHFRDVGADVGREIQTSSEYQRLSIGDVVIVAASRISEALRSLEEYGKIIDANFAQSIERLRYRSYELEQRLLLNARACGRFGQVRLYVIITEALCANDWFATARAALDGGADCVQLREKKLSDRELLDRAQRLAALCRDHQKLFILNDRPDIALLSNAHGVHLGQDDVSVVEARRILPPEFLIGRSTHTVEQIAATVNECPDYIAVGPMFDSATKPQSHIAGPQTLARAREMTPLPLVAIGGINAENAGHVLRAASCCPCVCSAVIAQSDPKRAAAQIRAIIDRESKATPRPLPPPEN